MPRPELTPRRQRFVSEYLIDLNATQAAIRAGYSPRTAASQGQRLLRNVEVQQAISAGRQAQRRRAEMTADEVLHELTLVAGQRAHELYRPDGSLKQPSEWDEGVSATVAGVEVTEVYTGRGRNRRKVGTTKKVKRWDKLKALELLGKRQALWVERQRLEGPGGGPVQVVEEIVDAPPGDGPAAPGAGEVPPV